MRSNTEMYLKASGFFPSVAVLVLTTLASSRWGLTADIGDTAARRQHSVLGIIAEITNQNNFIDAARGHTVLPYCSPERALRCSQVCVTDVGTIAMLPWRGYIILRQLRA